MMTQTIDKKIRRNILLNPGPGTTSESVKSALVVPDICPREDEFGDLLCSVRQKTVDVVNGDPTHEAILLGGSGTGAVEACLSSCVDSHHSILILDNGAYGKRMEEICEALGIDFHTLRFEWGSPIDILLVDNFLSKNAAKFRVLAFVHHETTTGLLNPLKELHRMAKKYNLLSLVDAMSSYAGVPIDVQEDDVDYLISSSNKCIQGIAGLGIVIAKKAELKAISKFKKKSYYFDLYRNYLSQRDERQFLFTPPVQILYALDRALDEFFAEGGVHARYQRYCRLYDKISNGMAALGFRPLVDISHHSKILTAYYELDSPDFSFDEMHDFLFKNGITVYPGKLQKKRSFRVSNLGDLRESDIELFLNILNQYLPST